MQKVHIFIRNFILTVIDGFYSPFKKLMPLQTFRYAACGGTTTALDIFIFFISYNFIVHKQLVHLGFITISPHIFSFMIAFCFSFPTGFYLNRYVVWQQTQTKKRVQFFRYFIVVMICVVLNYFFLHLFVDHLGWWPTVSKIVTSLIVIMFSYFTQRHYSFRAAE